MYAELAATGNAALFVGEVHGVAAAADLVTMCGDTVRGRLSGFDRSGTGGRLSVPGAVRWEIIRWAKRSGHRWLDFGGLSEQTLRELVDGEPRAGARPGPDFAKLQRDAARSAGWFERVDRTIGLDPVAFGYSLRTRRESSVADGHEPRRPLLDYGLHRATQWRAGRAARRTAAATLRVARRRQAALHGDDPKGFRRSAADLPLH
jgi:hypothetical protein